jgi:hypothetical protein
VPASYLRPWVTATGALDVEMIANGTVVKRFRAAPESRIFALEGYYALCADSVNGVDAGLLETQVLAEVNEPTYVNVRRATLDEGGDPSLSQAMWLAESALVLYYRSPRFHELTAAANRHWGERAPELFDPAIQTLALVTGGAGKILTQCLIHLHRAAGPARFWTTDTPCWMWFHGPDGTQRLNSLVDLENGIRAGRVRGTRWVCALTPAWAVEVCPLTDADSQVVVSTASDEVVGDLNGVILLSAHKFRVRPPEA